LEEMPFPIQRLQTDRGTEFFAEEVQRRLMDEAIRFRPIPPRSPHLNGKVERAQRTTLEEFWGATDPKAADVGDQLALWVHHYNWHRSHESLHGDTPIDRVCQRADKTPLWAAISDAYDPAKEHIQIRTPARRSGSSRSLPPRNWTRRVLPSGRRRVRIARMRDSMASSTIS
jgi:hypothetical protein